MVVKTTIISTHAHIYIEFRSNKIMSNELNKI